MDAKGKKWFKNLQQHVQRCRQTAPLPDRSTLTNEQETQCCIVGSSVILWLKEHGPHFLQERQVLHKMKEVSPDPWIVFTSNVPGLIAANIIVGQDSDRIVYLSEDEFKQWLTESPDEEYRWHVHFWSFFLDEVQPGFPECGSHQYPIPLSCVYWQHAEGTMWGRLAGRGVNHLWKWDGNEPALLEEALTHWVS